jgi:uncharacterized protein YfbU (UPF0304 family)
MARRILGLDGETAEFRLDSDLLRRVDLWRERQSSRPSRDEAVAELIGAGLAGTADATLSEGEKLILTMLCDLYRKVGAEGAIDPEFLQNAVRGGHYWAVEWQYPSFAHGHDNTVSQADFVSKVLSLWRQIEESFRQLSPDEKGKVMSDAALTAQPSFPGWDGHRETDYMSIARFMTDRMNMFPSQKGKAGREAGRPSVIGYRKMLELHDSFEQDARDRKLTAQELVELLKLAQGD